MIDVVWTIVRDGNHFLLAQRSLKDIAGGTWTFPGGKIDQEDKGIVEAASRELTEEVGILGIRFRKISDIVCGQYHVHIFVCDQWNEFPKPSCNDIIGTGWFTIPEIYSLGPSLAPSVNKNLLLIAYLIQHHDINPDKWNENWEEVLQ